jgi:GTP-binding protein HflX
MEKALLVTIRLDSEKDRWEIEDVSREMEALALTSGAQVVDNIICQRDKPTPNLFIGKGKAEELAFLCQELDVATIIFSHNLSGTQQRNLDDIIDKKTIDRTQLILDIFARHAKTPEGKMQVELAQLQYLMPRLVGKGVMLSRLGGGIGTRGPGEQKLEVDRRRIRKRIDKLKEDLRHLTLHRQTMRKKRKENALPTVALVGYTNSGKSTLLNALTGASQIISEGLFTTLDPISKSLQLPAGEKIILSDTVGFLHNLPHHLIEAFKATLEEVMESDLLIHVLDASHPRVHEHAGAVITVLKELQADKKPTIIALNKTDLLDDEIWLARLKKDFSNSIPISAKLKHNLDSLLKKVQENFQGQMAKIEIFIPHSRLEVLDLLYRQGRVEEVKYQEKGAKVKVNLPKVLTRKLLQNQEIKEIH